MTTILSVRRGNTVVLGGDGEIGPVHRAPGQPQTVERLRAGDLVDEVQVDVDEIGGTVFAFDDQVVVPHFFRKSSWFVHLVILLRVRSSFVRTHLDHAGDGGNCH